MEDDTPPALTMANVLRRPHWLLATAGGLGLCKPWPGTWGSVGGVVLFAAFRPLPLPVVIPLVLLLAIAAVAASSRMDSDLGVTDHQAIVIDEVLGMWLTLLAAGAPWHWPLGFILFRIFDIWKPWPVRQAGDRFPGGWGVVADDILAAVYAAAILLALRAMALI